MTPRRTLAILTLPAAFAIAGCSSSTTSGSGAASTAPSTSTGSTQASSQAASNATTTQPSSNSASTGGLSTTAATLAAQLQNSFTSITSAHIELNVTAGVGTITGSGDEKVSHGRLVALSLGETVPNSGTVKIVILNGKVYANLPKTLNTSGKPWILVSTTSSNATVRQIAASIASTQNSASLTAIRDFVTASSVVKFAGSTTINNAKAQHYSMVVQTAKLPDTFPSKAALVKSGITSIPLDLYIDSQGRPVRVGEKITVSGQSVTTRVEISRYNQPVTITAPPASQVSTS